MCLVGNTCAFREGEITMWFASMAIYFEVFLDVNLVTDLEALRRG